MEEWVSGLANVVDHVSMFSHRGLPMKAQLEIQTKVRVKGRFVAYQNVLVYGEVIGSLFKHNGGWAFGPVPYDTLFDIRGFATRDDAIMFLFDRYTSEPETGPFSLLAWRNADVLSWLNQTDQVIEAQYQETDDYLMRQNSPDYHSWLDSLECA